MLQTVTNMDMTVIAPAVALVIGILILFVPRLLNFLVAIYLIFVGIIGLWPHVFPPTTGA